MPDQPALRGPGAHLLPRVAWDGTDPRPVAADADRISLLEEPDPGRHDPRVAAMAKTIFFDDREWTNWHLTVKDVPIGGRFELHNSAGAATLAGMKESVEAVQKLIARAFAERRRLRAQGSAWSFSEAPSVPGGWSLST